MALITHYSDTFTRADANPVGSPYFIAGGRVVGLQIVSNRVRPVSAGFSGYAVFGTTGGQVGQRQFARATCYSSNVSTNWSGVLTRVQSTTNAACYMFSQTSTGGTGYGVWRIDDNGSALTFVPLSALPIVGATFTTGDILEMQSLDDTHYIYLNGVLVNSYRDSTYKTGYPAAYVEATTTVANSELDNFVCGEVRGPQRNEMRPRPFAPGLAR